MSTSFPTTLDDFPNPVKATPKNNVGNLGHAAQHQNANDAIEAIQAVVGITGSTVTTSHDFRLVAQESATLTAKHFGLVGDGSADDTAAMVLFFNSAIANPGIRHVLDAKTYLVTEALPPIDVANVWIEGAGAEIHDGGSSLMTGTVISYAGDAAPSDALVQLGDVSGGSSQQRRSNIIFRGVGLNCNSLIGQGLFVNSIRESKIDVAVANATDRAVNMYLTFVLDEARDPQRNDFRLKIRQVESPDALGIVLGGDGSSNISLNDFWVDAQHANVQVLYASNSDNNTYHFFRAYKVPAGTATESVALLGGVTSNVTSRSEKFKFFTANTPIHVYGTETYDTASVDHTAFLDGENGTPAPIIGTGASIHVEYDSTNSVEDPWISYTLDVQSTLGTLTSVTNKSAYYKLLGKVVYYKVQFTIATNGSGDGALTFSLPTLSGNSFGHIHAGLERAVTGKMLWAFIDGGVSAAVAKYYDGSYPGTSGGVYVISGSYEVP